MYLLEVIGININININSDPFEPRGFHASALA